MFANTQNVQYLGKISDIVCAENEVSYVVFLNTFLIPFPWIGDFFVLWQTESFFGIYPRKVLKDSKSKQGSYEPFDDNIQSI